METRCGKDALHDTIGIIYQNICSNTVEECEVIGTPVPNNEENLADEKKEKELLKPYL